MKHAVVRTAHDVPDRIAASLRPDNTTEMETTTTNDSVVTEIRRDETSGLQTTIDDYLVNLQVAAQINQEVQTENMTTTDNTKLSQ